MSCNIFRAPPEVFHKIVFFATLASPLGPPKELLNCMLVCRIFWERLLPKNASQLYFLIFAQKFDARGPIYRLTKDVIHEHAPLEMRRRFEAIHIFKNRMFDHPGLTEALWIAYLMVEDSDTSQKNIKQLLRVGTLTFLDSYLRSRLKDDAGDNLGWPIVDENVSLAIALAWTLASPRVMGSEHPDARTEMVTMLKPITFASFRYSISCLSPDSFEFADSSHPLTSFLNMTHPSYPISAYPPQQIDYFGAVKRKARPPLAAIFATLLYFVRVDAEFVTEIPAHVTCETRAEAIQQGLEGPCAEDFRHFFNHCRTRFADFPGIDVGIQSSSIATNPDTILCQPSFYRLGSLTGQWQGMFIMHGIYSDVSAIHTPAVFDHPSVLETRRPFYLTIEEHYCCDTRYTVPVNRKQNAIQEAWLPEDIQARQTPGGIEFTDEGGTFLTTYTTHVRCDSESSLREHPSIVDIIITAKACHPISDRGEKQD
uniref:F-box domain-containing protein n=1 Tax=Psilocybe cubensis TaxID=181762 RepID=A0A8H8CF89_PSICU